MAGGESGSREVVVDDPPSCAESIRMQGLEGMDVHCQEPPPASGEDVVQHGPYRLIPEGYRGTLTYESVPVPSMEPGIVCHEDCVPALQASPIYLAPGFLPDGYTLSSMDTSDGSSQGIVRSVYTGPGNDIEIYRVLRLEVPTDASMGAKTGLSLSVVEPIMVGDAYGIFYGPAPGSPIEGKGLLQVSFMEGTIETHVRGYGLSRDVAMSIAESMEGSAAQ
jgi:hypothetical protein